MTKTEIIYPNIEAERARLGLNREEFACAVGLTRRTYYAYLRGKGAFSANSLIKMSGLTKKCTDYLLGLKESR